MDGIQRTRYLASTMRALTRGSPGSCRGDRGSRSSRGARPSGSSGSGSPRRPMACPSRRTTTQPSSSRTGRRSTRDAEALHASPLEMRTCSKSFYRCNLRDILVNHGFSHGVLAEGDFDSTADPAEIRPVVGDGVIFEDDFTPSACDSHGYQNCKSPYY